MYTTCILRVYYVHTACILRAYYVYTPCTTHLYVSWAFIRGAPSKGSRAEEPKAEPKAEPEAPATLVRNPADAVYTTVGRVSLLVLNSALVTPTTVELLLRLWFR